MDYVINALGLPFNGDTVKVRSLGGSESAAYYLARELAARGHRVTIFTAEQTGGVFDGVTYVPAGDISEQFPLGKQFEFYARNTPHDVLVIQRHPLAFTKPFAAKVTIWQTHDLALHRTAGMVQSMLWNTSAVTVVSEWHKQQVLSAYSMPPDFVHVVPNGVDPTLYEGEADPTMALPTTMPGLRLLYQSRPERGLEHLVRPGGIMDRLRGIASLFVCGYDNTTADMAPYYDQLATWAMDLPNAYNVGALTKKDLASLQRSCDALIYPTEFEEVSCITAMEAMHAGLPIITSRHAALPETCRNSGTVLIPLMNGRADEDAFVAEVRRFAQSAGLRRSLQADQLLAAKTRTWTQATDALERVVESCFRKRTDTSMLKHWMKVGDIATARHYIDSAPDNAIVRGIKRELALYDFLDSDEAYQRHYDESYGVLHDIVSDEQRRQPLNGPRWWGVEMLVGNAQGQIGGGKQAKLRVLDFGCAHGHYCIGLAKKFPECEFHGIDISGQAIQDGIAWMQDESISNVSFTRADSLDEGATGLYDVIILAEVLEHVRDYRALLESARSHLTPGGALVITTPYGPWEWMTYSTAHGDPYKSSRQHWQHFERADWEDICAGMSPEIVCAPGGEAQGGTIVGSWCVRVHPGVKPFGTVNMERKRALTMPEQTVSACLIVKDAATTLRRTLDSLVPWVSEVLIGIDPASKDGTPDVIAQFAAANPCLPVTSFEGLRALEVGFGEARNNVVDRACGDWILWLDSDEELIAGNEIVKLLRPNAHPAYCAAQIHYSIQPPQVLTTDYPSRLFRNGAGVRFYGMVHEHPETRPGKAIEFATMRGDYQFAHNGYITEEVRRKRFMRNLPLLMRDIEAHPDRLLNKFLLIRDLAQGVGFELQQSGGVISPQHRVRAQEVMALWRELLPSEKPVTRMLLDSMQYVTLAAEILGGWFTVDVTMNVQKLSSDTKLRVQGKLLSAQDFTSLINRLSKEATANYDSAHF